jgi:hypothetical protein
MKYAMGPLRIVLPSISAPRPRTQQAGFYRPPTQRVSAHGGNRVRRISAAARNPTMAVSVTARTFDLEVSPRRLEVHQLRGAPQLTAFHLDRAAQPAEGKCPETGDPRERSLGLCGRRELTNRPNQPRRKYATVDKRGNDINI